MPLAAPVASRLAELLDGLGAAAEAVRALGFAGGILLALVGVVALTIATRHGRPLAVLGGALLGALAALAIQGAIRAHLALSPPVAAALAAAIGGAGCGAYPGALPFVTGALPGALLGSGLPLAGEAALGAAAGGLVGGLLGLAAGRLVRAAFAGLAGGTALALGFVAMLGGSALGGELARRPFALLALAVVLGIAGAAFQLSRGEAEPGGPPPLRAPDDRRSLL